MTNYRERGDVEADLAQRARDFRDGRFLYAGSEEVDDGWTD